MGSKISQNPRMTRRRSRGNLDSLTLLGHRTRRELERSSRREQKNDNGTNDWLRVDLSHSGRGYLLLNGLASWQVRRIHAWTRFGHQARKGAKPCQSLKPNPIHGAITVKMNGVRLRTPAVAQNGTTKLYVRRSSRPSQRLIL